ncbi:MAG: cation:proton antiporter [Planctomycetota bacterium]
MTPASYLAAVVVIGVLSQWIAWRIKVPAILLLLGLGFVFGTKFPASDFIDTELLFPAVTLAVAVILFEGGLTLRVRELKQSGRAVFALCSVGAVITWVAAAAAAKTLGLFETWHAAALTGAILTVTGPTVVGPLLRQIRPRGDVAGVAKWEGIVIDPVGAVLAVLTFEVVLASGVTDAVYVAAEGLFLAVVVGVTLGIGVATLLHVVLSRHLVPDYLEAPLLLAAVLGVFAVSNEIQPESGLVTVTAAGFALANRTRSHIQHLVEFKERLGVLLIGVLFVVLSGRVSIADVAELGPRAAGFVAILILLVRPVAVFVSTIGSGLSLKEKVFLSWLAPRGIVAAAVASVFTLELEHALEKGGLPVPAADVANIAPLTFLVIVSTVTIYGLTAGPLARWLDLAEPDAQGVLFAGAGPVARSIARALKSEGFRVLLVDINRDNVRRARMDDLPVRHGNVLSESVQEELDMTGIGRCLAATPNDEVNALVATALRDEFGRANCFQLAPVKRQAATTEAGRNPSPATGRVAFSDEIGHSHLLERVEAGAEIRTTRISEEFTYDRFREEHGGDATVLFTIKDKRLTLRTADAPDPQPGQTIVTLIDTPSDPAGNSTSTG